MICFMFHLSCIYWMKRGAVVTVAEQTKTETLTTSTATLKKEDTTVPATRFDWQVKSRNKLQWLALWTKDEDKKTKKWS